MGYYADTIDTDFTIPAASTAAALADLKEAFAGQCPDVFSDADHTTLADIVEGLTSFQECEQASPEADFILGHHRDKYLPMTDELLGILSRHATEGSYVRFLGEDNSLFGFRVIDGQARPESGDYTWTR